MADYIPVKEAARLWNITDRSVTGLCRTGRIDGAVKNGRDWMIPADAEKPTDKRVNRDTIGRSSMKSRIISVLSI